MQTYKTRQKEKVQEEEVVEEKVDTTETEAVLEECDSCLSDIDDILDEVANTEPPTEPDVFDIVKAGPPSIEDFATGDGGFDWDAFMAAKDKYAAAYEDVTGMSYEETEEEEQEQKQAVYDGWGSCTC